MINCIVVDDEPLAREAIISYIKRIPELHMVAECENAVEAMSAMHKHKIDLIFLDIEMPEINGISFLKSLKHIPHVIFTTAYRNYAVDAFDLDVIDFLLKPISFDRFLKAIDKVFEKTKSKTVLETNTAETNESFINVKADRKTFKIKLTDIIYIESLKDYVKIHTTNEVIITHDTLQNIKTLLPDNAFVRIHRSFIVAKSKIQAFDAETIYLENIELPISRTYKMSVLGMLNNQ